MFNLFLFVYILVKSLQDSVWHDNNNIFWFLFIGEILSLICDLSYEIEAELKSISSSELFKEPESILHKG